MHPKAQLIVGLLTASVAVALFVAPRDGVGGPPAKAKTKVIDLSKPFEHDSHLKELRKEGDRLLGCGDCHALGGLGDEKFPICKKTRMPFPAHDKCTGCHPRAFFTKPLQICSNCHTDNTFSQKPPLKEQNARAAPLKSSFSHKLHLNPEERTMKRFKWEKDCTFCHPMEDGGAKVGKPAHAQCCDCHTKDAVEPSINDCAGCHTRPKTDRTPKSQIDKFSHVDHTTDPRTGSTLECARCHFEVNKADKVRDLKLPVMATCVECHSGEVAFDYTSCLKCHAPDIMDKPVPETHKAATRGK
jgi:hypothetical protein